MRVYNDPRVDKEIRSLEKIDNSRVVHIIELFKQYGFGLPERYLKKLMTNLWELRRGRWRLLFGMTGEDSVIVNVFLKQTQKTPKREIDLAMQRLKEYI